MSELNGFETDRLRVRNWRTELDEPQARAALIAALEDMLSPKVLQHLPPPLQLSGEQRSIDGWIAARDAESDVMLVSREDTEELVGLLILAPVQEETGPMTLHFGYLLGEAAWGQGYGTELITGLVTAAASVAPVQLIGGVDTANGASARVLEKAGFSIVPGLSAPGLDMFVLTIQ